MKKWGKELFYFIVRLTGMPYFFREVIHKDCVSILTFHNLSIATAEILVQVLKRKYNVCSLAQLQKLILSDNDSILPSKAIIITMDDGYIENKYLKQIMEANGIVPTIFICADIVNTNKKLWFQNNLSKQEKKHLKKLQDEERIRELRSRGIDENTNNTNKRHFLNLEEINGLKGIFDFQFHSATHPILTKCDDDKLDYELRVSKERLENLIEVRFYAFAYPNGTYNSRVIDKVKESNFEIGLTMNYGRNNSKTNPYLFSRIPIDDNAGINEIVVKSSGFYDFIIKKLLKCRNYRI